MRVALLLLLALAVPDAGEIPDASAIAAAPKTEQAVRAEQVVVIANAIARMQQASSALKDFTATFHSQEYKSELLPAELVSMKYRAAPQSVYFKWIGVNKGLEVLWKRGWNGDQLRAHSGSFPSFTVNLKPDSWLAMRSTRHPINQAGFDFTISMFARDLVTCREKPQCARKAVDEGERLLYGVRTHCYFFETDKDGCPEVYGYRARLCLNEALSLPNKVEVWDKVDGEVRLVEDYGYEDIRVDVGLTDSDFDPERYGF